jgi:hypothetical protein
MQDTALVRMAQRERELCEPLEHTVLRKVVARLLLRADRRRHVAAFAKCHDEAERAFVVEEVLAIAHDARVVERAQQHHLARGLRALRLVVRLQVDRLQAVVPPVAKVADEPVAGRRASRTSGEQGCG